MGTFERSKDNDYLGIPHPPYYRVDVYKDGELVDAYSQLTSDDDGGISYRFPARLVPGVYEVVVSPESFKELADTSDVQGS